MYQWSNLARPSKGQKFSCFALVHDAIPLLSDARKIPCSRAVSATRRCIVVRSVPAKLPAIIMTPMARMRNSGGFHLPPCLPAVGSPEHARAVELLGACTQKGRNSRRVCSEVESLVGAVPPSFLIAQQWKKALTNRARKTSLPPNAVTRPREQHTKYMNVVHLPASNEGTCRAFVLLDALRRRYWAQANIPHGLQKGVEQLVGYVPVNSLDTFRSKNALKRLQRNRKSSERRPLFLPENVDELRWVDMTLGHIAMRGRIREKSSVELETKIGRLPRTKQLAASWQKFVKGRLRRRARKSRVAQNFEVAETKRSARQAKRHTQRIGGSSK
jgi:hypothetical protein